ncbi:MAG: patatin-like phospholipase family protein [Pseudomonadota bacterium]
MSKSLEKHLDPNTGPKRILALSGGGVRGLISLGILSAIESIVQEETRDKDVRLCDYFDLIAGTSTGSIIATALALGWKVSDIKELYHQICPVLFKPNRRLGFFMPKFDAAHLEKILKQTLDDGAGGQLRLGSDKLRTGLLICAKRMDTDSAWVLTNHPKSKFYSAKPNQTWMPNKLFTLASLIQASAAAPSYLKPVVIDVAKDEDGYPPEPALFVDGAISGHNCPALIAYQVATLKPYAFNWKTGEDNLSIVSVGTGQFRSEHTVEDFKDMQTYKQALESLKGLISESQRSVIKTMQAMSNPRPGTSWVLNSEVLGLEGTTMTDGPLFNFRHIDATITNGQIEEHLKLRGISERKLTRITENMREMANGRKANLTYCEQLGMSVGSELTKADLFL